MAGFVYGMPNDRAHWWSTVVQPYLREQGNEQWLDDSFVITELHVHPDFQGRGIGRALITAITDTAAETRSILSAIDGDTPARHLYRSLGYRDLARPVHFPSAPRPYAVMGAPLPLLRAGG
jgi:ribosomal protein S18 acetylase RimI-like enzyme